MTTFAREQARWDNMVPEEPEEREDDLSEFRLAVPNIQKAIEQAEHREER